MANVMQNYGLTMGDFGINNLRKKQLFENYGMGQEYEQSQDPYIRGDMGPPPTFGAPTSSRPGPFERDLFGPQTPEDEFSRQPNPFELFTPGSELAPKAPPVTDYSTPNLPVKPGPIGGPQTMDPRNPDDNVAEAMRIRDLFYKPDYTDRDRFRGMLDAPPEREAPGLLRRIAAMGIGLGDPEKGGGVEGMEKAMYAPYLRDMAEWKAKGEMFEKAADNENQSNINSRLMAGNMATGILGQNRLDAEQRRREAENRVAVDKNRITEEQNKRMAEIRMVHARAEALKAQKWDIKVEGDSVYGYSADNPPQRMYLGSSAGMDDYDKLILQSRLKKEEIVTQGGQDQLTRAVPTTTNRGTGTDDPETTVKNAQNRMKNLVNMGSPMAKHIKYDELAKEYRLVRPEQGTFEFKTDFDKSDRLKEFYGVEAYVAGMPPSDIPAYVQQMMGGGAPPQAAGGTTPPSAAGGPRTGAIVSADDKARAAIRGKVAEANSPAVQKARQAELEGMLASPSTPNQIKPAIKRELDEIIQKQQPPGTPPGRIAVYDKDGNNVGHISNTPEMIAEAATRGHYPKK